MKDYLSLLEPIAQTMDLRIVALRLVSGDLLEISIEKQNGQSADLEMCTDAAAAFSEALEYEVGLDVSSTGAERIIEPHDYRNVSGSYVFIKLKEPVKGLDHIEGTLKMVNADTLEIEFRVKQAKRTLVIDLSTISLMRYAVKI